MQTVEAKILLEGLCESPRGTVTAVVTDSRRVVPGCVFVCFAGARVDGHSFAAGAVKQGAAYIVATHPVEGVPADKLILVSDPLRAMVAMASNYRRLLHPVMIGVTGSVGKTTTKEFCAAVLESFGPSVKTEGNQNNEIGLPNTLFRMDGTTRYAVVEMGMSALGEISRLTRAARPGAGIITCIGVSHLENLGSRENILKAKMEICEGLPDGAPLVLNYDDALLRTAAVPDRLRPVWVSLEDEAAEVYTVNRKSLPLGESFTIRDKAHGDFAVTIPAMGQHAVRDALQAYTAATRLGLDAARAAKALANYHTTGMRQNLVEKDGLTLIEDCYNASPDSMRAAFETLHRVPGKRHLALVADMLELGSYSEQAHRELGTLAAQSGLDGLFTYGEACRFAAEAARAAGLAVEHFAGADEAAARLAACLREGDVLLVKGSRGMALENIIAELWKRRA